MIPDPDPDPDPSPNPDPNPNQVRLRTYPHEARWLAAADDANDDSDAVVVAT